MIVRRAKRTVAAAALAVASLPLGVGATAPAAASGFALPLGDRDLTEVRAVSTLAPGVDLMRITRGTKPARTSQIPTTSRGPWRVDVVSIDSAVATGGLRSAYGPDLAQVEPTSALVRLAGGLAGVNASFFTFSKNPSYPGDPVGLSVSRGVLLSEPQATSTEVDALVDSATNAMRFGRLAWTGSLRNTRSGATLALEYVNHPPVVPGSCAKLKDPTTCRASGDVTLFTPQFGPTPSGRGVEAVLDASGCPITVRSTRGSALASGQVAVQATGKQSRTLRSLTASGCLARTVRLLDSKGKAVKLTKTTYGVAGRYWLTRDGNVVAPTGSSAFLARNPRTLVGTTADGTIVLVTIDGRQKTSVGATLAEAAAVAHSLGLQNAINLDGGGSTSMALASGLLNTPSGAKERSVGDALVYVP